MNLEMNAIPARCSRANETSRHVMTVTDMSHETFARQATKLLKNNFAHVTTC